MISANSKTLTIRRKKKKERESGKFQMLSAINFTGFSMYPLQHSTNAASSAPSMILWSALQLTPTLNLLSPPRSSSKTHFARPMATMATPPPGTRTGWANSPEPIEPTLETVRVPPERGRSDGVSPQGVRRPREEKWERRDARL